MGSSGIGSLLDAGDRISLREVRVAPGFAAKDLLASGYVSGENSVLGKAALVDARFGCGNVVLFAFRPQFTGSRSGSLSFC